MRGLRAFGLALLLAAGAATAQGQVGEGGCPVGQACGGGGGSGDITGVSATGTAPVTVSGSPCTTGDCEFTLGLQGVTLDSDGWHFDVSVAGADSDGYQWGITPTGGGYPANDMTFGLYGLRLTGDYSEIHGYRRIAVHKPTGSYGDGFCFQDGGTSTCIGYDWDTNKIQFNGPIELLAAPLPITSGGNGQSVFEPHQVLIGPATGTAPDDNNYPTVRALVAADLPGGVLNSLTAGRILQATGTTAAGNTDLSYVVGKYDSSEPVNGRKVCLTDSQAPPNVYCLVTSDPSRYSGLIATSGSAEGSPQTSLTASLFRGNGYAESYVQVGGANLWAPAFVGRATLQLGGTDGEIIWNDRDAPDTQLVRDAAGQLGVYGTTTTYGRLNAGAVHISDGSTLGRIEWSDDNVTLRNNADNAFVGLQANSAYLHSGLVSLGYVNVGDTVQISDDGYGSPAIVATGTVRAAIFATPAQTLTVLDSGDGSPAAATLTPTSGLVAVTCSDADGCDLTLGESGIVDGQTAKIVNASANAVNLADTAGVSELTGAIALGQYDAVTLIYRSDRWIQTAPVSNN